MTKERHTILVVDDDQEIIDLLTDHFKRRNCETIATQDPVSVVDKLRHFAVKLMLLDLKMRRLDGFEVLDKIKQAGLTLPPTIIITGFLPKYKERLEAHGIHLKDVVTKPFTFEDLESSINAKLGAQVVTSEVGSEYEDRIYKKNRCRIGLVEDEEDILEHFTDFFKERNYQVFCFKNGQVAFEALKKDPVDILFVDIKLPGMQGDRLIEELAKTAHSSTMIPISADPLPDGMEARLKKTGCERFIAKPFDIVELIELVKTIAVEKGLLG